MKSLLILVALIGTTVSAQAATQLNCVDRYGNSAQLKIANNRQAIEWSEPWHSADSSGVLIGTEAAPYSEFKGFELFRLVDFYSTNDSKYVLAMGPASARGSLKVVVYFDNDDHMEEETVYNCR